MEDLANEFTNRDLAFKLPLSVLAGYYLSTLTPLISPRVKSTGTFPILSRDLSFQETIKNPGKHLVFDKNNGKGITIGGLVEK